MQPGTSASLITISSIVLLIFYCVSRSSLAALTSRPVQLCRSRWRRRGLSGDISSYSTRKSAVHTSRTLKTFGWRSKESLGALWLRNNAAEAQKYLFKWSPPSVRRQQEQASWWLSENKLAKLVASTTDMEPVPELGCELSLLFSPNQEGLGELTVAGRVLRLKLRNYNASAKWKDGTPVVTQSFYFQACRGKSTWTKEPNTAGQEFIVHFISTLIILISNITFVPYSVVAYHQ